MVSGATAGLLGYATRTEVAQSIETHEAANAGLVDELVAVDLAAFDPQSDLHRYAVARGASVFRAHCSQCHGSGAASAKGYLNLLDNDWLWGGTLEQVAYTIAHGVRNETDRDAHWSEMPAFGVMLEKHEIDALASFLPTLPGAGWNSSAGVLFQDNCASCHGQAGLRNRDLGPPNLADSIWLYGGDHGSLTQTITNSRFGVMPAGGSGWMRLMCAPLPPMFTALEGASEPFPPGGCPLGRNLMWVKDRLSATA